MKFKIYALPLSFLLALFITSCVKTVADDTPVIPTPDGTFKGKFAYLHRQFDSNPYDSVVVNCTLTMSASAGTFAVTADTTTIQAGSHGTFAANNGILNFADVTYPFSTAPVKKHLAGNFLYSYDGTTLRMLANATDTISYQYQLTKSN